MKNLIASWPLTGDYGTVQPGMAFSTDDATAEVLLERGDATLAPESASAAQVDVTGTPPVDPPVDPPLNPPGPTDDKQDEGAKTRQTKPAEPKPEVAKITVEK